MWRWTKRILLGIAIVVLTAIALLYFKQHALVYHPRADDSTYPRALPPDGVELAYAMPFGKQTAFYAPPPAGRIPQRLWVAFCGNGSLALDWTTILRGYPVATDGFLLVDYPGYGKCAGMATIASMRASTEAALDKLAEHLGTDRRALEPKLCAIGHSLGAAVALDFAARHNVDRVLVVAPFTSLREEGARIFGGLLSHLLVENYDNRARLAELLAANPNARIAIFHGENDGIIPFEMGRALSEMSPRIDFYPIPHADHISVLDDAREKIFAWMKQ